MREDEATETVAVCGLERAQRVREAPAQRGRAGTERDCQIDEEKMGQRQAGEGTGK